MKSITAAALASVLLLALMIVLLLDGNSTSEAGTHLTMYCAAGIQPPIEELRSEYEQRYGVLVEPDYRGSGTLLSAIEVRRQGDLYLAADDSYIELARKHGLVAETFHLATMRPVIAFRQGNPKSITGIADLLRDDVRVGIANPEAAAVGKITRKLLEEAGHWADIQAKVAVTKPTVNSLANDLDIGSIDAAVIWDATANQHEKIDFVRVGLFDKAPRKVTLAVLASSTAPTAAIRFARFVASRDVGREHFEKFGFEAETGDVWEQTPKLLLMGGGMLNKAIDQTVAEFEEREGVRITRIYNGCGILVAQMRTGTQPDAYFSCDTSFLDMVADRFEPGEIISQNRMVILVPKGNPKHILTLQDLTRKGLRVGLAHPEKSALGALAQHMLEKLSLWDRVQKNAVVWSPTGDFLVNQIRTGSLDATIVYRSNAAMVTDYLDIVAISDESAFATQPYAIAQNSKHKQTMRRLLDAILASRSRQRFENLGFEWKVSAGK